MRQLMYLSVAKRPLGDAALLDLLKSARSVNDELSITGVLLYRAPVFVQLLEGSVDAVNYVMQRIRRSKRHGNVTILTDRHVNSPRICPNWSMGFAHMGFYHQFVTNLLVDERASLLSLLAGHPGNAAALVLSEILAAESPADNS